MSSHIPSEKYETVHETVELINQYEIIAAADLNKVSSAMLQDMRKRLRGRHKFKVVKNTLMRISMEELERREHKNSLTQSVDPTCSYSQTATHSKSPWS